MVNELRKFEEIEVSFCPECKSYDVRYVFGLGNLFGVVPKMQCMVCNVSAPSFPRLTTTAAELEVMKNRIEKNREKKSHVLKKKTVKRTVKKKAVKKKIRTKNMRKKK